MKNKILIILGLLFSTLFATNNFPLYEIPNIVNYAVGRDNKTLYTIENKSAETYVVQKRELATGKLLHTYTMNLPKGYPWRMAITKDQQDIYILADTVLYNLDLQGERIRKIRTISSHYLLIDKFQISTNQLLIEAEYMSPILIDVNSAALTKLSYKSKGIPIFYDMDKGGAIVSASTADSLSDLYFAPFIAPIHGQKQVYIKVGQWQPKLTFSTNPKDKTIFPYFVIKDSNNFWVKESYEIFRYPTPHMFWADRPKTKEIMSAIPDYHRIEGLTVIDSTYLTTIISNKGLFQKKDDPDSTTFTLFNIKNQTTTPVLKTSKSTHEELKKLVQNSREFKHNILSDPAIFKNKIVETRTYIRPLQHSKLTNRAILSGTTVSPLKGINSLTPHIREDFTITSETITAFAEELNKLFEPPMFYSDTFSIKQESNKWLLSRKNTFSDKPAQIITVTVDSTGRIISLHDNLEEK